MDKGTEGQTVVPAHGEVGHIYILAIGRGRYVYTTTWFIKIKIQNLSADLVVIDRLLHPRQDGVLGGGGGPHHGRPRHAIAAATAAPDGGRGGDDGGGSGHGLGHGHHHVTAGAGAAAADADVAASVAATLTLVSVSECRRRGLTGEASSHGGKGTAEGETVMSDASRIPACCVGFLFWSPYQPDTLNSLPLSSTCSFIVLVKLLPTPKLICLF